MSLTGESQLVLRHQEKLAGKTLCLVNPAADGLVQKLEALNCTCHVLSHDVSVINALLSQGVKAEFAPWFTLFPEGVERCILWQSKERERLDFLLERLAMERDFSGSVWLVGEKKSGIKGSLSRYRKAGFSPQSIDNARHCTLLSLTLVEQAKSEMEFAKYEDNVAGTAFQWYSLPGVFSKKGLDCGTRLLLENLPELNGKVLDYGCGAGVIGCFLLARGDKVCISALDKDAMALAACRHSLESRAADFEILAADRLEPLKGGIDVIVSNPPFHEGLKTSFTPAIRMIEKARECLKPGGRLFIVANAFLPYAEVLEDVFQEFKILAVNPAYKVYSAKKR